MMDLTERTENSNRHPWELSRAQCILNYIRKYDINTIADIGAGDRFFVSKLKGNIYAIDSGYKEKSEVIDGINCLNDISELPKLNGKSALVLMDVLEHIEDDKTFLKNTLEKISTGDLLFITVPAFQFLFSSHDKFLKHYRRYNKKQLLTLIKSQNLSVEKCHYFYAGLFFARMILPAPKAGIGCWNFSEKHIITRLILLVLNIDFKVCSFLAKFHIYLPGLSLLAICKKEEK